MSEGKKLPVLRAHPYQIAERALVVGDTKLTEICAALLDDTDEVGTCHEYLTFTSTYHETPIIICSHGVGAAGASIVFHDLCVGDVKSAIRAGTCGAMQKWEETHQEEVWTFQFGG